MLVLVGIEPCHSRKYFFFLILKEYSPKNNLYICSETSIFFPPISILSQAHFSILIT